MKRVRILFVDDEESLRIVWRALLETLDYVVLCCATAEQALEKLDSFKADIAVIDLRLNGNSSSTAQFIERDSASKKGLDGDEFVRVMRDRGCNIPVIIMSGNATCDEYRKRMEAVSGHILSKPFFKNDLLVEIEKALASSAFVA